MLNTTKNKDKKKFVKLETMPPMLTKKSAAKFEIFCVKSKINLEAKFCQASGKF